MEDFAVIDVFDKKVVIYYTWTWYKKRLKKTGELGRPFIIRKNDIYNRKGQISNSKWDELKRRLANYLIYQRENGKLFKISLN